MHWKDGICRVSSTVLVGGYQTRNSCWIKPASPPECPFGKKILHQRSQRPMQPCAQWCPKSRLGSVDYIIGKGPFHCLLEYPLSLPPALFEFNWKTRGQRHEVGIKERHPHLHARSHTHLVRVVQIMIREKVPALEIQHAVQGRHVTRYVLQRFLNRVCIIRCPGTQFR